MEKRRRIKKFDIIIFKHFQSPTEVLFHPLTKKKERMSEQWTPIPEKPHDFIWESKDRFHQQRTRRYYYIQDVLAALEKSLIQGDAAQATYWCIEYSTMSSAYVTSTWAFLFQFYTTSISIAAPNLVNWLQQEYTKYKMFMQLPTTTTDATGSSSTMESTTSAELTSPSVTAVEVDERCLCILLGVVHVLAQSPKCRIVDSALRACFLPYPESTYIRPYEPHREHAHLLHPPKTTSALALTSYTERGMTAPLPEGPLSAEPIYQLYALLENDPPYLAPWANGLTQCLAAAHHFQLNSQVSFDLYWRGALYYAGLIYQCTEPCHTRQRKQDSSLILWDIISKADVTEVTQERIRLLHKLSDEISKNTVKREKYFVITALFLTLQDRAEIILGPLFTPRVADQALLMNQIVQSQHELRPIPDIALDYTTKEGQRRGKTSIDYIQDMVQHLSGDWPSFDPLFEYALFFESCRPATKDSKRKLQYQTPFLRFTPTGVNSETSEGTHQDEGAPAPPRGPQGKGAPVPLSSIYTFPASLFLNKESLHLTWRGQFIPFQPDDKFVSSTPQPLAHLENLRVLPTSFPQGLFAARFTHPAFEPEEIIAIPCANAHQALSQTLLDELKPLFGMPSIGTHSFYLDSSFTRKDKRAEWSPENCETQKEGSFFVCFPASKLMEPTVGVLKGHLCPFADLLMRQVCDNWAGNLGPQTLLNSPHGLRVREQIIDATLFHFCVGIPHVSLNRFVIRGVTIEGVEKLTEEVQNKTHSYDLDALANAQVLTFYELQAFSNTTFGELLKKLPAKLSRLLFCTEQKYVLQRYWDLFLNFNFDALESILQRFGLPYVEYSGVIRNRMRDLQLSWKEWSHFTQEVHTSGVERNREKERVKTQVKRARRKTEKEQGGTQGGDANGTNNDGEEQVTTLVHLPAKKKKLPPRGHAAPP
jgi:hypothetical protein